MQDASIVLLTYNGEKYLDQILQMIRHQHLAPLEVLAIDSGSSDRTLEILKEHSVCVYQISNEEFSHPGTRNKAVRLAKGRFIIFVTQDATPADSCWLERLLKPFQELPDVAGVYGRQVPRPDADPLEATDISHMFGGNRRVNARPENNRLFTKNIWSLIHFSNCSAAYDRALLLENTFDETLPMAEDQEWSKRMMEKGFSIVYEPSSVVLHSHRHEAWIKYRRGILMGASFSLFLKPLIGFEGGPIRGLLYNLVTDPIFILRSKKGIFTKLKWLFLSPLHRTAAHFGFYRGWNRKFALKESVDNSKTISLTLS